MLRHIAAAEVVLEFTNLYKHIQTIFQVLKLRFQAYLTLYIKLTRWVKLNNLIFNIIYRSIKYEFIDILN